MTEKDRLIATYTTIGLAIGLDWATARRIATEIVDEKTERATR